MPLFQVKLAQGKRSLNEEVEAKNLASLLAFYDEATTMKVMEVRQIVYFASTDTRPVDDMQYNSLFKTFASNGEGSSRQFLFHNLKLTKDENELFAMMKNTFEIAGLPIESIYCPLFKR